MPAGHCVPPAPATASPAAAPLIACKLDAAPAHMRAPACPVQHQHCCWQQCGMQYAAASLNQGRAPW